MKSLRIFLLLLFCSAFTQVNSTEVKSVNTWRIQEKKIFEDKVATAIKNYNQKHISEWHLSGRPNTMWYVEYKKDHKKLKVCKSFKSDQMPIDIADYFRGKKGGEGTAWSNAEGGKKTFYYNSQSQAFKYVEDHGKIHDMRFWTGSKWVSVADL